MIAVHAHLRPVANGTTFRPQGQDDLPRFSGADFEREPRAVINRFIFGTDEERKFALSQLLALVQSSARELGVERHLVWAECPSAAGSNGDVDRGARLLSLQRSPSDQ